MILKVKKLVETADIPKRHTEFSCGYDLSCCSDKPVVIGGGETVKIHTGIAVELEGETNAALLIYARSSTAVKLGLAPANCVGVVDWDYRGEIIVPLYNHTMQSVTIAPHERIAQLVITPVYMPEVIETEDLSDTVRGSNGFGSSGN